MTLLDIPHPLLLKKKLSSSGKPYVTLKAAVTLDGKIATRHGQSQWITGEQARSRGHAARAAHQGILVGLGTVLADDPRLTVRMGQAGATPARIVLDSLARIPLESRMLAMDAGRRIVIAGAQAPPDRLNRLRNLGVEVFACSDKRPRPEEFLRLLRTAGIESLLVEGGAQVHGGLIARGEADELLLFMAGMILGDSQALPWCITEPAVTLESATRLRFLPPEVLGADLLLRGMFAPEDPANQQEKP